MFTSPTDTAFYNGLIPGSEVDVLDLWGAAFTWEAHYYASSPAGLELVGTYEGGTFPYSDAKLVMPYPRGPGITWTDTYTGYDPVLQLLNTGTIAGTAGAGMRRGDTWRDPFGCAAGGHHGEL